MKFNDKFEKVKKTIKAIKLNKTTLIRTEVDIINQAVFYRHVSD